MVGSATVGAICGGMVTTRRDVGQCWGQCGIQYANLVRRDGSPWYGPSWYCVECGDAWSSEQLYVRPFARGWRQDAIRVHTAMWEAACSCALSFDDDLYPIPCEHDKAPR